MADSGDVHVDALANRYTDSIAARTHGREDADEMDDSELFDSLEAFDDSAYRSTRMQQLSDELKLIKSVTAGHGAYTEIHSEKELLGITTAERACVVHFAHADFARCRVMDRHLTSLAPAHLHTRFVRIDVAKCPFLVERLKIQVLPCVIPFVDGIGRERILGFEGLGGVDDFKTGALESTLMRSGVLRNTRGQADLDRRNNQQKKSIMGFASREEEDEEFDSDE